jgi:hypothetical protein
MSWDEIKTLWRCFFKSHNDHCLFRQNPHSLQELYLPEKVNKIIFLYDIFKNYPALLCNANYEKSFTPSAFFLFVFLHQPCSKALQSHLQW